tara:strand:+ start:390 stop:539 length:150 start_codon:yes stop_codon:yes gene_type:complete
MDFLYYAILIACICYSVLMVAEHAHLAWTAHKAVKRREKVKKILDLNSK